MSIPIIAGKPLTVWLGLSVLSLIVFQVLTGNRILETPFTWHRKTGYLILALGLVHGFMAFSAYL